MDRLRGEPALNAAVDWSGRAKGAEARIWTAVVNGGRLAELAPGRGREEVGGHLCRLAAKDPDLVVGLDFAFSLPLWFLDREGWRSGPDIPPRVTERWLRECPDPFWGRPGRRRHHPVEAGLRRTELMLRPRPKSPFQIGGAGAVGTASLRGFAVLAWLRREGFAAWPLDEPRLPMLIEIYPRLFGGRVRKTRPEERLAHLVATGLPSQGAGSEDAFDAEVSAFAMADHRSELEALPAVTDPGIRREGWIWAPGAAACATLSG